MSETIENEMTTHSDNYIPPEVQALLDEAANKQASTETNIIPFMSFKNKKFAIGDDKLGDNINVVLLADVFDNSWYDRPYDAKSEDTFPPACFSIYQGGEDNSPHETSPMPQSYTCGECPKNQFGSKGNGKACRNGRRFLVAGVGERGVNLGSLAIINIAPTSLKNMSKYLKNIATIKGLPSWAIVTNLRFDEDVAYPLLSPAFVETLPGDAITEITKRLTEFKEIVSQPYDVSNYEAPSTTEESTSRKSKVS